MFYVYVLRCSDGSLYTGYTNDIEKRIAMHNSGKASRYTRSRLPVETIARWVCKTKSEAMAAERMFKCLTRDEKLRRIREENTAFE